MSTFGWALTTALTAARVLAGVLLVQSAAAAPAPAAAPDPFSGERAVVLAPKNSEGILGLSRDLSVEYAERQGPRNRFVLVPSGERHLIKTAAIRRGGEPMCLQLGRSTVVVNACDAGKRHQLFSFRPATPSNGKPTWTIRTTRHRYLVQNDLGGFEPARIVEGTADVDTAFLLVDKGQAELPELE